MKLWKFDFGNQNFSSRKLHPCRQSPIIAQELVPADDAWWRELFPTSVFQEGIGTERKLAPNIYLHKGSLLGSYLDGFLHEL